MDLRNLIKSKILWRVYLIWFLRRVLPLIALQVLVLVLTLKVFAQRVFVVRVLGNAAVAAADSSYWEFFRYLLAAFFQTRPIVQIAALIGLGVGALILRDVGRSVFTYIKTFKNQ